MNHSENVPIAMKERYEEIIQWTDGFSKKHLNEEYAQVIRYAVAALCRKKNTPLAKGRTLTWACAVTHARGFVNFLTDKSDKPYMSASDLYKNYGVSQSTGQGKSKIVRDLLDMFRLDPEWTVASKVAASPLTWMLLVNGMIVDVRYLPREFQEIAYEKGLIPYIPADKKAT